MDMLPPVTSSIQVAGLWPALSCGTPARHADAGAAVGGWAWQPARASSPCGLWSSKYSSRAGMPAGVPSLQPAAQRSARRPPGTRCMYSTRQELLAPRSPK
jgi:hypothetical protein